MIICKNCGAEYDDEQDRCPYCGGDNFGKSVQVHEDMMNELEREKKRWKEMPEKVAGKGMSWTAKLGIAAVIMVAVICIIVFIVSSISHKVSYRVEQKNLEKLESECDTALWQIDDRMYAKEYEDDYDQVLCYGISFFKKRCMVKKK